MKRFLPRVIGWCLLFLVCAALLSQLTLHQEEGNSPLREYYAVADKTDVVFLGASQVFCGVSPAELYQEYGISSFDMANGNQYMSMNYFLIREILRVSSPSLIVLDVSTVNRAPETSDWSHRQYLATMKFSPLWWKAYQATRVEGETALSYLFPVLRYHDRWNEMAWHRTSGWQGSRPAGQMLFGRTVPQAETTEYPFVDDGQTTTVEESHLKWLEKIIELCQAEGQPLLLVKVPGKAEGWSAQVANTVSQVCDSYGESLLDLDRRLDETGVDMQLHTLDGSAHLNMYGAQVLSRWLGGYLRQNYDIPDRRGQEEYDQLWQPVLESYHTLWDQQEAQPQGM